MRIVLINGAPRTGKDACFQLIKSTWNGTGEIENFKLSKTLKDRAHKVYGLQVEHDFYEESKDLPQTAFMGITPRQAYINMSNMLKAAHGEDLLGHLLVLDLKERIRRSYLGRLDCAVITDSGFREEAMPLVQEFGAQNIVLIRLTRPGRTWTGDSRGPIDLLDAGVPCYDIANDGTLVDLAQKLGRVLS